MNVKYLNTANLDTNIIKKGGSSSGGVTINNQDKTVEITENGSTEVVADSGYTGLGKVSVKTNIPFEEKVVDIAENGTTELVPDKGYFSKVLVNVNVPSSGGGTSKPTYTGHADVEGLKAIGWTDEDIAYYQENGVNWNEEEDEYHKVPEDNIALYGVLTASNISTYKNRIVYLPKIDTSGVTDMSNMFKTCYSLVSIPRLDTANVTDMTSMFSYCYFLTSIPQLDTSSVTSMSYMFNSCRSLVSIPQLDTANVTSMTSMFSYCSSLVSIPQLDTSKVTDMTSMFDSCTYIQIANLKNLKTSVQIYSTPLLEKDSLLYIINNEAATSAITIKLSTYCYNKYSVDADVVSALANHPNISLTK